MLFDHLFVLLFAIIYPVIGYFSFKRLLRCVARGEPVQRLRLYAATFAGHWMLFGVAMLLWASASREAEWMGFGLDIDAWFMVATALTLVGVALLLAQLKTAAAAGPELVERIHRSFGALQYLLPHNGNELARFSLLAITAGIVEETLWRGYLIWYLTQYMPMLAAALISVFGFGLAHAYQGARTIPRITLVGGVFTGIYLLSDSLWLPMILHAAVDLLQGRFAYEVIRRRAASSSADAV